MLISKRKYKITFVDDLIGTVPKDPDIYETHLLNKLNEIKEKVKLPEEKIQTIKEEELLTLGKMEEKGITGFHSDEQGVFIYNYMFRGFLKNAGNVMKGETQVNVKNLKSKVEDYLFVNPRKLYLQRDGKIIKEIDGHLIRPIQADDRFGGKRVFIGKSEKINAGCYIEIELLLMQNKDTSWDVVEDLLPYGQLCGVGQARNMSYGSFTAERIKEYSLESLKIAVSKDAEIPSDNIKKDKKTSKKTKNVNIETGEITNE